MFPIATTVQEFLDKTPSSEEVLTFQSSSEFQSRVSELLEKNRTDGLTEVEGREWAIYEELEHLVRLAKINACIKQVPR